MFNTPRIHRWFTLPAAIALFAAMATSASVFYFVVFAPPMLALPFIVNAAIRRTECATARALTAIRFTALVLGVIGLLALTETPYGAVWIGAAALQLGVTGTNDERSLGAATLVSGVLMGAASWFLIWIRANPELLLAGVGLLVAGGAIWVIEAHCRPLRDDDLPAMTVAA